MNEAVSTFSERDFMRLRNGLVATAEWLRKKRKGLLKEKVWFTVECPEPQALKCVCNYLKKHFRISPVGLGTREPWAEYYVMSRHRRHVIKMTLRKEFPKTKVLT